MAQYKEEVEKITPKPDDKVFYTAAASQANYEVLQEKVFKKDLNADGDDGAGEYINCEKLVKYEFALQ